MDDLSLTLAYAGYSIKGKHHRFNEDRICMLGNKAPKIRQMNYGEMFAVFDGMGSAPKGTDAAQHMCDVLMAVYDGKAKPSLKDFHDLLFQGNMDINAWGCNEGTKIEMGACAGTIVWFQEETMTVFHAGDTIGLLIKNDSDDMSAYGLLTTEHAREIPSATISALGNHS